ncbi:hypothetical protein ACQKLP_12245 [Chitinophaga sp. NPDC101104]|uniref:hypothetical protein n=1 Tax=Chitinophaga sp. NPDC101104 TaxID=3390561 RepID=UPI003D0799B0
MFKKILQLIKKSAAAPAEEPLPAHWKELSVHPDTCTISTGTAIRDTSNTRTSLDTRTPYMETWQQAYIRCNAQVQGKTHHFMSEALNIDPQALHMHLLQQARIRIWYDPAEPGNHRFDLSFFGKK